jgi:hypothetical protein
MPRARSKSQQSSARRQTRHRSRLTQPVEHRALEQLRRRFERFRDKTPPTARIPVQLRKAVVVLLQAGVTRSAVQKSCGVSWDQMAQWTRLYGSSEPRAGDVSRLASARVLSVVGDAPAAVASSEPRTVSPSPEPIRSSEPTGEPLELRFGGWSITVRAVKRIAADAE